MISIIVPVFNTEKYVKKCIDSILQQSLKEIEVILVDDGSSDNSGKICDEYAKADRRVCVVHQRNAGRVAARQKGLQRATFDYVMFLDSDDWIERNMCEELLKLAVEYHPDLITSGYISEDNGLCELMTDAYSAGFYATEKKLLQVRIHCLAYHGVDQCGILPSIWAKLYRKNLAVKIMEYIPKELYLGEDLLFSNLYLLACSSIYISKAAYYHYRIHDTSTMQNPIPDFISQIGMLYDVLNKRTMKEPWRESYLSSLTIRIFLIFLCHWNKNQNEIHIPYYCFQMEKLGRGKIVLYGAGKVGIDYYEFLRKLMPGKVTLWVDKAYQNYHGKYQVCPVEMIEKTDFDKILIAVNSMETADKIRSCLVSEYAVPNEKILWQKPDYFWF